MKFIFDTESKIKNIIFDLGNVILDIDINRTLQAFKKLNITGLEVSDIHPHQRDFFLDLEVGLISDEQFIEKIYQTYPDSRKVGPRSIMEAWNVLLLDFEKDRFDMLRKLSNNHRIFLLSNTNHPHRLFFLEKAKQQLGVEFESFFEKCYYSDVLKMRKPDVRIYKHVIEDAGIDPSQTLFIDDNECNFSGAEEAGLNYYHLTAGNKVTSLFK